MFSRDKSEVAAGLRFTLAGQTAKVGIQFASLVLLTRFLSPEDFGLVAMTLVFIALAELLRDFGLTSVGIKERELSQQQSSNLLWANTLLGVVAAVLVASLTPAIVAVYGDTRLWNVNLALSSVLLVGGFAAQYRVQAIRNLKFKAINVVEVFVQVSVLATALLLAIEGFGYWSLVLGSIVGNLLSLVLFILISGWVPSRFRRGFGTKTLLREGSHYGLTNFILIISSYIDSFLIGAIWGATKLGYYDRAFQLHSLPISKLISPLTQVIVPFVNKEISRGKNIDSTLSRFEYPVAAATIFIFAIAGSVAPQVIPLLFGSDWNSAIVFFQILSFAGMTKVLVSILSWRVMVENRGNQLMKITFWTNLITAALITASVWVSVEAVALSVAIGSTLAWPIVLFYFGRQGVLPSLKYLVEGLGILVPGIVAYGMGYFTNESLATWGNGSIVIVVVAVTLTFAAGLFATPGGRERLATVFRRAGTAR